MRFILAVGSFNIDTIGKASNGMDDQVPSIVNTAMDLIQWWQIKQTWLWDYKSLLHVICKDS